jgi:hypothetical protein
MQANIVQSRHRNVARETICGFVGVEAIVIVLRAWSGAHGWEEAGSARFSATHRDIVTLCTNIKNGNGSYLVAGSLDQLRLEVSPSDCSSRIP